MLQPPDPPAQLTILGEDDRGAVTDATCSAVSFTSTDKLHERLLRTLQARPRSLEDRIIRDELISEEEGRVLSQTPPSGRDWGPYGPPPPEGPEGPQPGPTRGPWRWYHRWWVMLGGILLALIVGALALGAFQSYLGPP